MSRKRKTPITHDNVALLFDCQTIDEVHDEKQGSFHESPRDPYTTSLGEDFFTVPPTKKPDTVIEVHDEQQNLLQNSRLRTESPSCSANSTGVDLNSASPAKKSEVVIEVHEKQENFHVSRVREKLPSCYPTSTTPARTDMSPAPPENVLAPHPEVHERQESFHESFQESPSIRYVAPSYSTCITSPERSFISPLSGERSDTQIEGIDKQNCHESPSIKNKAPSSAQSHKKSGILTEVTDKQNFHKSPNTKNEAPSSSSTYLPSSERSFSSALSGEKSDAQTEVTDKLKHHERLGIHIETPSFFSASNASAKTRTGIVRRKMSDSQLVVGGQNCEGRHGGGVQLARPLRRRSLILVKPEKLGSGENRAPSFYPFNEDAQGSIKSDVQSIMSRQRSASLASLEYYRTEDTTLEMPPPDGVPGGEGGGPPPRDRHYQQSRRLPFWMWFIIAKSLGIKLHAQDKPILATVLYILTFVSAMGYILSNWWFMGYNMANDHTKTTVIDATVSMFYTLLWGALGLYANKLAFKLFSHKKFVDMLRLHSKTILKMNASVVLFSLMLLIAIFNNISAFPNYQAKVCESVGVEVEVCQVRYIFRVIYSFFTVLWNYLVAFVLVSTCRTHVIGIRRFMKALEKDARMYESRFMGLAQPSLAERPILEEYTWVDEDYLEDLNEHNPGCENAPGISMLSRRERDLGESQGNGQDAVPSSSSRGPATLRHTASTQSLLYEAIPHGRKISTISYCCPPLTEVPVAKTPGVMSNAEILFRYWKIQSRLRMSSVALQRWMMSIIVLVVMWLAMNLIIWLNYNPSLIDLANFFLPLSLLPLLASAYAEVNQEGQRLLKFICLLEERLHMLFVLQTCPLQMTVYSFSLTYTTITTAAFGILLAFASKVLIQEIAGDFSIFRNSS